MASIFLFYAAQSLPLPFNRGFYLAHILFAARVNFKGHEGPIVASFPVIKRIGMTLYQFLQLDKVLQEKILWNEGVFIDIRNEKGLKLLLYQVHSFYIELFYDENCNTIHRYRCFSSTSLLKPYLNKIKLNDLLPS